MEQSSAKLECCTGLKACLNAGLRARWAGQLCGIETPHQAPLIPAEEAHGSSDRGVYGGFAQAPWMSHWEDSCLPPPHQEPQTERLSHLARTRVCEEACFVPCLCRAYVNCSPMRSPAHALHDTLPRQPPLPSGVLLNLSQGNHLNFEKNFVDKSIVNALLIVM